MVDITKEEEARIKAEAQKEVDAELKKNKLTALKEKFKQEAKDEYMVSENTNVEGEKTTLFTVDLPESCPDLRTNGKLYRQGHTYALTANERADIVARTAKAWEHHKETREGKSSSYFSRPRRRTS